MARLLHQRKPERYTSKRFVLCCSTEIDHTQTFRENAQMECDSMHVTIERKLKNREIYSPAQYVEICKTARLTKPYDVQYL